MRCAICGAPIKPWFEVCYQCNNPTSRNAGAIPQPIIANKFMKEMKINVSKIHHQFITDGRKSYVAV